MIIQFTVYGCQCDICNKYFTIKGMEESPHDSDVYQSVMDVTSAVLTKGWMILDGLNNGELGSPKVVCPDCLPPHLKIVGNCGHE